MKASALLVASALIYSSGAFAQVDFIQHFDVRPESAAPAPSAEVSASPNAPAPAQASPAGGAAQWEVKRTTREQRHQERIAAIHESRPPGRAKALEQRLRENWSRGFDAFEIVTSLQERANILMRRSTISERDLYREVVKQSHGYVRQVHDEMNRVPFWQKPKAFEDQVFEMFGRYLGTQDSKEVRNTLATLEHRRQKMLAQRGRESVFAEGQRVLAQSAEFFEEIEGRAKRVSEQEFSSFAPRLHSALQAQAHARGGWLPTMMLANWEALPDLNRSITRSGQHDFGEVVNYFSENVPKWASLPDGSAGSSDPVQISMHQRKQRTAVGGDRFAAAVQNAEALVASISPGALAAKIDTHRIDPSAGAFNEYEGFLLGQEYDGPAVDGPVMRNIGRPTERVVRSAPPAATIDVPTLREMEVMRQEREPVVTGVVPEQIEAPAQPAFSDMPARFGEGTSDDLSIPLR